jgi:hypothetical protein
MSHKYKILHKAQFEGRTGIEEAPDKLTAMGNKSGYEEVVLHYKDKDEEVKIDEEVFAKMEKFDVISPE